MPRAGLQGGPVSPALWQEQRWEVPFLKGVFTAGWELAGAAGSEMESEFSGRIGQTPWTRCLGIAYSI